MANCTCTPTPYPNPTNAPTSSPSTAIALGLEWPEFEFDVGGSIGIGLFMSVVGNIVNGVGYVTQNVGHYKTGASKCLFREMRNYGGSEKERLEEVLNDQLLEQCGEVGERAEELARDRLEEIKQAEEGDDQASSGRSEEEIENILAAGPNPWTNPIWVAGFLIYAVGSLMNAVALGFAPAALIAPLEGLTLVTNAVVAPMLLPEKLRTFDVVGIIIIMIGVAICVLFGPSNETEWTVEDLVKQWANTPMIVYTIVMVILTIAAHKLCEVQVSRLVESGEWDPHSGKHMDLKRGFYVALGYCWIAGTLAAYNGLFTSAWSTALTSSFEGTNYYSIDASCVSSAYLQVIAFFIANFSMEYWKQRSLSTFDSIFIVPVFQVLLVVLVVVTTGIFYQDFEKMYSGPVFMFIIGVLTTCGGVAILSYQVEANNKSASKMLLDALDNVDEGWAHQIKKIHQQALQQKVQGRVNAFLTNLKSKVEASHETTSQNIQLLSDMEQREQVLEDIEHGELKNVVRMLIERIEKTVDALDAARQSKDMELRRGNSLVAQGEVRSTPLGSSMLGLAYNTNERANLQSKRQQQHSETEKVIRSLGGGSSRSGSRANSNAPSRNVTRPSSAAGARLQEAKSAPEVGGRLLISPNLRASSKVAPFPPRGTSTPSAAPEEASAEGAAAVASSASGSAAPDDTGYAQGGTPRTTAPEGKCSSSAPAPIQNSCLMPPVENSPRQLPPIGET